MKRIKENSIVLICIGVSLLFAIVFRQVGMKEYGRYQTDTLTYEKAKVVEVLEEQLEYDEKLSIYLGEQTLLVSIPSSGEEITIKNYLTKANQVHAQKNTSIIVNVDKPEKAEAYYTVFQYDRSFGVFVAVAILAFAIIAVGRKKGVKTILGLVYSLFLIVYVLLPTIFSGYSPIVMSVICSILCTAVTLLLLNGQAKKTYAAILATTLGVVLSFLFYLLISNILHINGFSASEVEGLILINKATGLQIKEILYAGVLIASLGAIMDVGLSIVSALYEVYYHNPTLNAKQLFTSGMEIGKDMIGTMSNTLILAFTGSAFISLLIFLSYQVELNQLLNSNFIALEIAQGVCGTLGVVLTVPIASILAAFMLTRKNNS